MGNPKIEVTVLPQFYIFFAVALLVIPLPLLLGWVAAAIIHELCHCLMLRLCRCSIFGISIGAFGAEIYTQPLTNRQAFLCALAGPFGGLLLTFFVKWVPVIALCGIVQSGFNLLPLFPMDGGRAVQSLANHFLPEHTANKLCRALEISILLVITAVTVYFAWRYALGLLPLAVPVLLALRTGKIKSSCKPGRIRVQ